MISAETRDEMRELMARYPQPRSALLPMLHLVQSVEGYVTTEGIETCAELLDLTPAEVAAVATFYTMYKRRPVGDYHVGVCTNTLCAVLGGDEIFACLKDRLGVGNDETTEDGAITLEHVECNAACDYAPVVMVNWEFFDNMTSAKARQLVDELRGGREVQAGRGARVRTWREVERVLAGFPDGAADEGLSAGPASVAGLEIADANDWAAPPAPDGMVSPAVGSRPTAREATRAATTRRAESEALAAEVGAGAGSGDPAVRADTTGDDTAQGRSTTNGKGSA